jgi:hypothetical protein
MSEFVRRKLRTGIKEFEILDEVEAKERGLTPLPWRTGKAGDWVMTDDGYVCLCLDRKTYRKRTSSQDMVILAFCRQWVSPKPLKYLAYKTTKAWGGTSPTPWVVVEARKTRTKNMVKIFVKMMLNKNIDYTKLGLVYRPDQRIPAATVRRLLRQEEIKKMVDAELNAVLSKNGITRESVIQMYLDAARIAKENAKAGELRAIASDLADYLEMKPKNQKMLESGMSDDIGRQIEEGMKQTMVITKSFAAQPEAEDAKFEILA